MSEVDMAEPIEGIAIVGMAGRFPQAKDLAAFWQNLCAGVEATTTFTDDELEAAGVPAAQFSQPTYVRSKAILEEPAMFDAAFFGLSPREAEVIDPQHRIFLESAWEALEDAGYDPEAFDGAIGVYAGSSMNTYLLDNLASNPDILAIIGEYQAMLGNDKDFLPTRVSYKLNLTGPSVNVQTACSTSLVAVAMACQSLLSFQCDMALAGGVSVMFPQHKGYVYREGGILSPDGHCRTFDQDAQGMYPGQGVGIVVLRRLEDALADGDHIYAVIRGSAINNDGALKVGYTAPSVDGQAEVIGMAQALAEVEPESIGYVEAHGTATPLGDPIEIAGLSKAFRAETDATGFCAIGSVKTNIGHLDAAAGVAGLIKTALALKHRQIPPSLNYTAPNPKIDFESSPFYVNTALAEWPAGETPRRAGVSSFGIGGTNAHVVLEEAPVVEGEAGGERPFHLLPLSARSETALQAATERLAAHLAAHPEQPLADVAYTLQAGRRAFAQRRIVAARDHADAVTALRGLATGRVFDGRSEAAEAPPVVFMFSGQGSQYVGMGRGLYEHEPVFRAEVDRCAEFLKPHLGLDLRQVMWAAADAADGAADKRMAGAAARLQQTDMTQPALFVMEYALAQLYLAWGIRPQAMIGHSIGEYAAACLAGVFTLEEALALVAARGRLMQQMPPGSMLVVPLPEAAVRPYLTAGLSVAVINGPEYSVISGPDEAIDDLQARLAADDVNGRRLHTSHAFHSSMMAGAVDPFAAQAARVRLQPPQIPFLSNVSGTWITDDEATDPNYWARHIRETVRFGAGLDVLLTDPATVLLEVGPGQVLSSLAEQHPARLPQQVILSSIRHPRQARDDVDFLLTTLGRLWLAGVRPDWAALHGDAARRRVPLPTYPFERQRYWIAPRRVKLAQAAAAAEPVKKKELADWLYAPAWRETAVPALDEARLVAQARRWLLFVDERGVGAALAARLRALGQDVVTVRAGAAYAPGDSAAFVLPPDDRAAYDALFGALAEADRLPDQVIHLWGVDGGAESAAEALVARGFYSLLYLAQAIGRTGRTAPLGLLVVTDGMQAVAEEERPLPEKATILGPCRVIPQEFPFVTCRSVDLAADTADTADGLRQAQPPAFVARLLAEAAADEAADRADAVVAYRGGVRYVQGFEAWPAAGLRQAQPAEGGVALREGGVYLITGGLGGVGLALAAHLAARARARLVLLSRSGLPAREAWAARLVDGGADDGTSQKIRQVQALEALGAEVLVLAADVADRAQVETAVAAARARFGAIHGVVHAAGVAGGGMIQLKTADAAARVLAAKVTGTRVLAEVLDVATLDFMLLCSSINAVLATFGQVDYAAANAYLDAFAQRHHGVDGAAVIAVNWDTWREVGMAVETAVPEPMRQQREETLKHALLTHEGQAVFQRILEQPAAQVLVSTRDFAARQRQQRAQREALRGAGSGEWAAESGLRAAESGERGAGQAVHARPELAHDYASPRTQTEAAIAALWQEYLGVDRVGVDDNFFDLGGSSLLALRLFPEIEKISGRKLPMATLFEAPTVAQLAALVAPEGEERAAESAAEGSQPAQPAGSGERRAAADGAAARVAVNGAAAVAPGVGWPSLVAIQPQGSKPPLFCVHAAGGHVLFYRDLVRHLGPEQPVYGLQAQGVAGDVPLLKRVEDMATRYVGEIRQVQPHGPYMIIGYCMGGTVALEMAQQLHAAGEAVALLGLFETYNWKHMKDENFYETMKFFGQKAVFHWNNFKLLNSREKRIFLNEKWAVAKRRSKVWYGMLLSRLGRQDEAEDDASLRPGQLWDTNDLAALAYRARPYPGRITHFVPVKEYARHQGALLGWEGLAEGGVDLHKMPVYPAGMLVEPFVEKTAAVLTACIDEALAGQRISVS